MIADALTLALREIRNNLMRAGLTTLGVAIGVAAVIAMATLGSGAAKSVTSDIASMGHNLLIVVPGERRPGLFTAASSFDIGIATTIARDVRNLAAVAPAVAHSAVVIAGNRSHITQVTGTTNAFFVARDWPIVLGRNFFPVEASSGRSVCILGETARRSLLGGQSPIGVRVRIGKISCSVIGVLAAKGKSTFGQDQDDCVMMPIKAVQRRIVGNGDVNTIWISVTGATGTDHAKANIERVLRERRHIQSGAVDDFNVDDMQDLMRMVQSTTAILTAFLSAVAAISLLVGGIGIMNVMLVSVTERTREIGIRLAIGARERDVLYQFLIEAVVTSAFGGIVGIVVGLLGSFTLVTALGLPFVFEPGIVIIALCFSACIGVTFGYFPARRAALLNPIEALRRE